MLLGSNNGKVHYYMDATSDFHVLVTFTHFTPSPPLLLDKRTD